MNLAGESGVPLDDWTLDPIGGADSFGDIQRNPTDVLKLLDTEQYGASTRVV